MSGSKFLSVLHRNLSTCNRLDVDLKLLLRSISKWQTQKELQMKGLNANDIFMWYHRYKFCQNMYIDGYICISIVP